ncbi:MAG: hypothetical protein ACM3X1_07720 [Ignavibacteriales bacterium]
MNRLIFLTPLLLLLVLLPSVYAGGPRLDYDQAYQDIEGAPECWRDGYDAGFAGVYDRERARECSEIAGDQYNASWPYGCKDGGYSEYRCENIKKYSNVRIDHKILADANRGKCWTDGFEAGSKNDTYNFDRASGCSEYGSLYRYGFIQGCQDPTPTKTCESYTKRPISN